MENKNKSPFNIGSQKAGRDIVNLPSESPLSSAGKEVNQLKEFLYEEIINRREYSASKSFEVVLEEVDRIFKSPLSSAGKEVENAEQYIERVCSKKGIIRTMALQDEQSLYSIMEDYADYCNQFKSTPSKEIPEDLKEEFYDLGKKHNVPMHVLQQLRQIDNRYIASVLSSKEMSDQEIEDYIEKVYPNWKSDGEWTGKAHAMRSIAKWVRDQLKQK